jgi:hypothetical protein
MDATVSPSLADRFRSLLEAVKEGCAREKQWGLLAGPMALVTWIRTRRERKEAAAVMEQVKTLLEEFVALLKEVAAAEAGEPDAPAGNEAGEGMKCVGGAITDPSPRPSPSRGEGEGAGGAVAAPHPPASQSRGKQTVPLRPSAPSAVNVIDRGERGEAQRWVRIVAARVVLATHWIPAFAGMTGIGRGSWRVCMCCRFLKPDLRRREKRAHFVAISKLYHLLVGSTVFTMDASSAS